jgi:hypothetical protein
MSAPPVFTDGVLLLLPSRCGYSKNQTPVFPIVSITPIIPITPIEVRAPLKNCADFPNLQTRAIQLPRRADFVEAADGSCQWRVV